jgi:hypothetical protein
MTCGSSGDPISSHDDDHYAYPTADVPLTARQGVQTILWRTLHDFQEPHAKHVSFDTLAKLTYLGAAG